MKLADHARFNIPLTSTNVDDFCSIPNEDFVSMIIDRMVDLFKINRSLIFCKSRKREIVDIKRMLCYLLYEECNRKIDATFKRITAENIGILIDNADHATILHRHRSHKDLYQTNSGYRKTYDELFKTTKNLIELWRS